MKKRHCAACKTDFYDTLEFLKHIGECQEVKKLINNTKEKRQKVSLNDGLQGYKAAQKAGIKITDPVYDAMIAAEKQRSLLK